MSTWHDPITDLGVEAVPTTLFNEIGDCLESLHHGGGIAPADTLPIIGTAPDYALDISTGDLIKYDSFIIGASLQVHLISTTNRPIGNKIHLLTDDTHTLTLLKLTGTQSGYAQLSMKDFGGTVDFYEYQVASFIYNGATWQLMNRNA
jgi:hypothetical protein